jgi:hypothetical protein
LENGKGKHMKTSKRTLHIGDGWMIGSREGHQVGSLAVILHEE